MKISIKWANVDIAFWAMRRITFLFITKLNFVCVTSEKWLKSVQKEHNVVKIKHHRDACGLQEMLWEYLGYLNYS